MGLGVGPGIRAAGSADAYRLAGEPVEGLLQLALNGRLVVLKLEPVVVSALVLDDQGQAAFFY